MKYLPVLFSTAAVALAAGCTPTIKTQNEVTINPIQITMDVNLRVDRELNQELASTGDVKADPNSDNVRERRRARRERILAWKNAQLIGEANSGLLVARTESGKLSASVQEVIDAENVDRKLVFEKIATRENLPVESIAQRMSGRMNEISPVGTWVQDAAGNWSEKQ